ncbi:alpha/beta fold hydrolase [Capilliphycus salinus ALCB114379]|uniref:alpha/beta fold hydrolase n=1 Tax=Capilliphycus salinus TaxID=2768948 RepID=UPI0039A76D1D
MNPLNPFSKIALAQQEIQHAPILTPLQPQPIQTAYIHQGEGKIPILLLHGFDSSVLEFYRLVPRIKPKTEVWGIDLLGFGFSERHPRICYNPGSILSHLYHSWKTLIGQPLILLGASMGGATAIDFTLAYPEIVQKLILIDSVGYGGGFPLGQFLVPPLDGWAVELWRQRKLQPLNWGLFGVGSSEELEALRCVSLHLEMPGWVEAMISFTRSGGYLHLSDRISELNLPTLILWGDKDEMLGTEDALKFKRNIRNCEFRWISNCGHAPHLEQPQVTAEYILEFLDLNF